MYFIFKHVEFSGYKDEKGRFYHYTENSPNFKKVKEGAKVLCYQKENNSIFAFAEVKRIKVWKEKGVKNFLAFYSNYVELEKPLELSFEVRRKVKLKRDLEMPSPGIIPISAETFQKILRLARDKGIIDGKKP